jgi:hypothetical protein
MTHRYPTHATAHRRRHSPWVRLWMAFSALLFALHAMAQAPAAATGAAAPPADNAMDDLVGRIALYPDDLVSIILPASTSPLQIVQADRWLEKRKSDPKLAMDERWDDAVKTLLNYPDVVKMMSNDLDWTSALGEAVVADQGAVLEGIQSFRRRAQAAGNLKSDDKQVVKAEKEIIIIQPANPQVIYVPQYTPSTVITYGVAPVYGYYPAPYPSYYYPYAPGAALAAGVIWGAAIGAAWNGGRWGADYNGGDINIDIDRNTNINRDTNINRGSAAQRPAAGSTSNWKPNKQPGQVSSSVGKSAPAQRVGDARGGAGGYGSAGAARPSTQPGAGAAGAGARPSAQPGGGAWGGGTARPSTQPSGGGAVGGGAARPATQPSGSHGGGSSANRSGDAFGGYSSGRQAQMDSSRGASSRSSMSGAAARPAPGGGRARGGGGRGGGRR